MTQIKRRGHWEPLVVLMISSRAVSAMRSCLRAASRPAAFRTFHSAPASRQSDAEVRALCAEFVFTSKVVAVTAVVLMQSLRSAPREAMEFDVMIVGAGPAGLSAARVDSPDASMRAIPNSDSAHLVGGTFALMRIFGNSPRDRPVRSSSGSWQKPQTRNSASAL